MTFSKIAQQAGFSTTFERERLQAFAELLLEDFVLEGKNIANVGGVDIWFMDTLEHRLKSKYSACGICGHVPAGPHYTEQHPCALHTFIADLPI